MSQHAALRRRLAPSTGAVLVRARNASHAFLRVRPLYVLPALVVVQWLAVLGLALDVRHDRWLYYQGGDQIWHYTGAWLLAHGHLPVTLVGYGWSLILAPLAAIAGPQFVSALPAIVVLNVLVLLPISLLAVFGIADRIAGRAYAYGASLLWIVVPFVGIRMALEGYHQKYTEVTLPQSLGLTAMSDFPSVVALLVAAYFCLRALDRAPWINGAAAGLAAGYALAIKPSNALFLLAPLVLFAFYGVRVVLPFAAGIAPSVVTLALWKDRGLGHVPAFSSEPGRRLAAGATASIATPIHKYVHVNWSHLNDNRLGLKEHFWSERLIDWLVVAGLIGLFRRSRKGFALVAPWFVAYLLVKGGYVHATVDDASFFRLIMPIFPAFVLLIAAIPFLLPGVRAVTRRGAVVAGPTSRRALAALAVAAVVFAVVPLAVVAAATPLSARAPAAVLDNGILVPVQASLRVHVQRVKHGVVLTWRAASTSGAHVFPHVLRGPAATALACTTPGSASAQCSLGMTDIGSPRHARFVDRPGSGRWTYRVALTAAWIPSPRYGDVYAVSNAVTVDVP